MIQIFIYLATIFGCFFVSGYWLTNILVIKRKLKTDSFWLVPWIGICYLIFSLTLLSLGGLSLEVSTPIILGFSFLFSVFTLVKRKNCLRLNLRDDLIIGVGIALSVIFNLLIYYHKCPYPTAVSFGNNDIIAYVTSADFLHESSLLHGLTGKNVSIGAGTLIDGSFRWGVVILTGLFESFFSGGAYKFIYFIEILIFALLIPLLYKLFETIYQKSASGLIILVFIYAFNVNLLYILYHNFFGQVLFSGLNLLFFIWFFPYLNKLVKVSKKITFSDYASGVTLAIIYMSYHEAVVFILLPVALYLIFLFVKNRAICIGTLVKIIKIGLVTFISSSVSIFHNLFFDFYVRIAFDPSAPIGWQKFRQQIPFANPFEMLGFSSIHSTQPLPTPAAILLSGLVVITIIIGLIGSKYRFLISAYLLIYLYFLYNAGVKDPNYFDYNRLVTYALPLIIILFTGGLILIFKKLIAFNKIFILVLLLTLISIAGVELFWAKKLSNRFVIESLIVDKQKISLEEIPNYFSGKTIYTEDSIKTMRHWDNIWQGYFLFESHKKFSKGIFFESSHLLNPVPSGSLVLLSKPSAWELGTNMITTDLIWENDFYKLGVICNDNKCLLNNPQDLSKIDFGNNNYEDSLLLSGWGSSENGGRWSTATESALRLVTHQSSRKLVLEILSLSEPQTITIFIDEQMVGSQKITDEWNQYTFTLPSELKEGVHHIIIQPQYAYSPAEILGNQDLRKLYIRLKSIGLE